MIRITTTTTKTFYFYFKKRILECVCVSAPKFCFIEEHNDPVCKMKLKLK